MSLEKLRNSINKSHGKETAVVGNEYRLKIPIICSTGSLALDYVLGCNGLPEGRIIEYYGPPSGGKTTLSIISIVEAQKKGGNVAFLDIEGTFDRLWFENLGGNSEKLLYVSPGSGAQAFEVTEELIKSKEIDFIVIDSVSAMATSAEIDAGYDDVTMAQLARLMSSGLKKINNVIVTTKSKCSVLYINQTRKGIGPFSSPEVRGGGLALDFYASIILAIRRKDVIGDKEDPDGFITKIDVKKNKCGRPFRVVNTNLYLGKNGKFGINKDEEIVDVALSQNVIQRCKKDKDEDGNDIYAVNDKGKSYKFEDTVVMGKKRFVENMLEDRELFEKIKNKVKDAFIEKDIPEEGSYNDKINQEIVEQDKKEEIKREKRDKNV